MKIDRYALQAALLEAAAISILWALSVIAFIFICVVSVVAGSWIYFVVVFLVFSGMVAAFYKYEKSVNDD